MKHKKLLELAKPHLEENDFGADHTLRVLEIANKNYNKYDLDLSWKDTVFSLIILHDIGGSEIKDQYEKGPVIAKKLLEKLDYHKFDIKLICAFIAAHHERLEDPHDIFKILFDSDRLVMLSKKEFDNYNSRKGFDWQKIIHDFYNNNIRSLAVNLLEQRGK
jgi:HD superfamily phosphohydrolase YqeK